LNITAVVFTEIAVDRTHQPAQTVRVEKVVVEHSRGHAM
jgi:hypothetical protein